MSWIPSALAAEAAEIAHTASQPLAARAALATKAPAALPLHTARPKTVFERLVKRAVGIVVSLLSPEREAQEKFEDEKLRTYLGVGAE